VRTWLHGEFQPGLKYQPGSEWRTEILLRPHEAFSARAETFFSTKQNCAYLSWLFTMFSDWEARAEIPLRTCASIKPQIFRITTNASYTEEGLYTQNVCAVRQFWDLLIIITWNIYLIFYRKSSLTSKPLLRIAAPLLFANSRLWHTIRALCNASLLFPFVATSTVFRHFAGSN